MKIAALAMVTLFVIYFSYNLSQDVMADECWRPGGQAHHRFGVVVFVVAPTALALASLVYLWSLV